jgi:hypothetical protein
MNFISIADTYIINRMDVPSLTPANIRFATHLSLPFRLRTGRLCRFVCEDRRTDEVCLRNNVAVPSDPPPTDDDLLRIIENNDSTFLQTDALVIEGFPQINDLELAGIRRMLTPQSPEDRIAEIQDVIATGTPLPYFSPSNIAFRHQPFWPQHTYFSALTVLNNFLVGYARATQDHGDINPLRRLTPLDLDTYTKAHYVIICDSGYQITDAQMGEMLDHVKTADLYKNVLSPRQLRDLPADVLARIPGTITDHGHHVFCEFAFEAERHRHSSELVLAVVYSVLALEGVHAAFYRLMMLEQLDPQRKEKLTSKVISKHLRTKGLYRLYKATSNRFINEQERPSEALLKRCDKGIQIRNAYMHSQLEKGTYKIRSYRGLNLLDAYNAVMEVYECYVRALKPKWKPMATPP